MSFPSTRSGVLIATLRLSMLMVPSLAMADVEVSVKQGLSIKDEEGNSVKVGGRIQYDWAHLVPDEAIGQPGVDGSEFRRARIYISGTLQGGIEWKSQYDFAGGDTGFRDVFVGLTDIPVVGRIRIGNLKEPFGLEQLMSSNNITFMERSPADLFDPERNAGFVLVNSFMNPKRMTASLGFFRNSDDVGNGFSEGKYNTTARVSGLAYDGGDSGNLVHLGLTGSFRSATTDSMDYATGPSVHLAADMVDTGLFPATDSYQVGLEAGWVQGRLSLQGEHVSFWTRGGTDARFSSWYLYASFMLTHDQRPYDRSYGSFKGISPKKPYRMGGSGAWELGVRYSFVDLNDQDVMGGELKDIVVGVNWYLRANTRFMFNYVYATNQDPGEFHGAQMRTQISY